MEINTLKQFTTKYEIKFQLLATLRVTNILSIIRFVLIKNSNKPTPCLKNFVSKL